MSLPDLTIGILTYKRPWYATVCIRSYLEHLHYGGEIRWLISDGGSNPEDFKEYQKLLNNDVRIVQSDNYSRMVNSIAENSGMVWIISVDDHILTRDLNVTPDVRMLMDMVDIGVVRYSHLTHWGSHDADPQTSADLIKHNGNLWWMLDKKKTTDPYMSNIAFHLYHRRFWDAYGNIPDCLPEKPGDGELHGRERFYKKDGPTVAVPFRFGTEDEPLYHFGIWRTDEYTKTSGERMTLK